MTEVERQSVIDVLHWPEYVDVAPRTAYAMLLDAGIFLAPVSTFYRILRSCSGTRGRRNELVHPAYAKPELLATRACEVWSWWQRSSTSNEIRSCKTPFYSIRIDSRTVDQSRWHYRPKPGLICRKRSPRRLKQLKLFPN